MTLDKKIFEDFGKECKPKLIEILKGQEIKVLRSSKYSIVLYYKEKSNLIYFEKDKGFNLIEIYTQKIGPKCKETCFTKIVEIFGSENEKEVFKKLNLTKLYFNSESELLGIFAFFNKMFNKVIKQYFEDDSISITIKEYFEEKRKMHNQKIAREETLIELQDRVIKAMEYQRSIRFTKTGKLILK